MISISRILANVLAVMTFGMTANLAQATTYTENFNAPFPAWESGWLGVNSNLTDYYCGARGCSIRGNNPDGIWPTGIDGTGTNNYGPIIVNFTPSFGATITSLSLDVAGFTSTNLLAYNSSNALIFDQAVALTGGAFSNPGVYSNYTIPSNSGISSFKFDSGAAAGNTSIDNVVVTTLSPVPEPEAYAMMLAGLGLIGFIAYRRKNNSSNMHMAA
jgi:hypothetical protein